MFESKNYRTFTVNCGELRVSDPCYKPNSDGGITIKNVKNGRYEMSVYSNYCDGIISKIIVTHSSRYEPRNSELQLVGSIGVDSGQAGVFDKQYYDVNQGGEYDDINSFYGKCCNVTLNDIYGSIDNKGVVSSSGYGDGEYGVYVCYDEFDKIDGVCIEFICDEEDEY